MTIFHEIYGSYYGAISDVLAALCHKKSLSVHEMEQIITKKAFRDSSYLLLQAIDSGRYAWVLHKDGYDNNYRTSLGNIPKLPLTLLEMQWLKTIYMDPRVKLFTDSIPEFLQDIEPVYMAEDLYICGQYGAGDDYGSREYKRHFRIIQQALRYSCYLGIRYRSANNEVFEEEALPIQLQYSVKENIFRLFAIANDKQMVYNLSRIEDCYIGDKYKNTNGLITFDEMHADIVLNNDRRTLERLLLYFSNYKRETSKLDDGTFLIRLFFPKADMNEVLVNILSFTPMVKIIGPTLMKEAFLKKINQQKQIFKSKLHEKNDSTIE